MTDESGEVGEIEKKHSPLERLGNIYDKLSIQDKGYNLKSIMLSDGTNIMVEKSFKRKNAPPYDEMSDEIRAYEVDVATAEEELRRQQGIGFSPLRYFVNADGGISVHFPTRVSSFVDDIRVGTVEFKGGENIHGEMQTLSKESNANVADKMLTWTEQMIEQNKILPSPLAARLA